MKVLKRDRMKVIFVLALALVFSSKAFAEVQGNRKSIGLQVGDPMAVSLRIPVTQRNFLNISGGIWAWHFWHDVRYDTPILIVDYAWMLSRKNSRWNFHAGIGLNIFFGDNPKDSQDYEACLGIRFPLGIEFKVSDRLSIGLELAPFFQALPPFAFDPYIIDQNGGIVVRFFL